MRQNSFLRSFTIAFLVGLSLSSPKILAAPCGPTINWNGAAAGITQSVANQNINVSGTNYLVDGISIAATTCDITVDVSSGDAVITGSNSRSDSAPSNPARLYLYATPGRIITFDLTDGLLFSGANDFGTTPLDLLVTVSGGGTVKFLLQDDTEVAFGPDNTDDGGTQFLIAMNDVNPTTVVFERPSIGTGQANVTIGSRSFINFAGQTGNANPTAILRMITSGANPAIAMLRLNIEDGGGFYIAGYSADFTTPNFEISDIDFGTFLGTPSFVINNVTDGVDAPFVIVNNNSVYPGLLSDPFCQGAGPGPLPGNGIIAPGTFVVTDGNYVEYIGTATNVCVTFTLLDECGLTYTLRRLRNGSAFIVDSASDAVPATIDLQGTSAMYFVSGVDNCGSVLTGQANPIFDYTVNTSVLTHCQGNIVLDVEGPLNVTGSSPDETGIEILSLQVAPSGCPVTVDSTGPATFPSRTFARQANGDYIRYNLGAFLINNTMTFINTSLIHTDTNHNVYEHWNLGNPNLFSEPTYIGGDSYLFPCHAGRGRPSMEFVNSKFRVHNSLAATGVDFAFPNSEELSNTSSLIFYNNGRCIDDGYGRNMILGTEICSEPCVTTTDINSHLNVFQTTGQEGGNDINLWIITDQNTDCITEGIPSQASIATQNAVQTIFLNNASNFSIGVLGDPGFDVNVPANVFIDGACISIDTRGGTLAFPQSVGTQGEGGVFVDNLGTLRVLNNRIASFGTMVTKSPGSIVDLPSNSVFFEPRVGIAEWQPNLSEQSILVLPGQTLSDYTLDWGAAIKSYCCDDLITSTSCFIPYDIEELPAPCACPPVTQNNLFNLPTIQGTVDQMQILRSRMCDFVHLNVDGGLIRELVFLQGFNSAEGPFGFIVLQNDGEVGLGSTHKDVDSLEASIVLGVNGVMLVPNGDGNVKLNEDILINNVCHIMSGTAFGVIGGAPNRLIIDAEKAVELRVKSTGILDLSEFTNPNQILEITGEVKLIFEAGSRLIMGGGTLRFSGNAQWIIDPITDNQVDALPGVDVNSTDDVRVKLSGQGIIQMTEFSSMFVETNAFFGVETFLTCSNVTDILWVLNDQASIQIGNEGQFGGAFQVGDTVVAPGSGQTISLELQLDGQGALFELNRGGFFGLAAGIVTKRADTNPNDWTVSCLSNVTTVSLLVGGAFTSGRLNGAGGTFYHNQIATGSFPEASLLAIGSEGSYTFGFDPATSVILGGGNMAKINCTELEDGAIIPTSVVATVSTFAGITTNGFIEANIMSGKLLLIDKNTPQPFTGSAQGLFNYLLTLEHDLQNTPRANIGSNALNQDTLGFIDGTLIRRDVLPEIVGGLGVVVSDQHSLQIGAVGINLDNGSLPPRNIINAIEIQGTGDF